LPVIEAANALDAYTSAENATKIAESFPLNLIVPPTAKKIGTTCRTMVRGLDTACQGRGFSGNGGEGLLASHPLKHCDSPQVM
jgi:hypothetical protein